MKKTIYNDLNNFFNKTNSNSDGNKLVLKSNNIDDINKKKLETQQYSFLSRTWQRLVNNFQSYKLVVEAQRIPMLLEYDSMDKYPMIGAALDILMEESTTVNNEGKVININAESKRVKDELDILFHQTLNMNTVLPMITRLMCKNGENFVYVDIVPGVGVRAIKQMPAAEIERFGDHDLFNDIIENKSNNIRFKWKNAADVEFKRYQVVHFRLLTDDKYLPYGVSVLEKVRRIWRNLVLTEDAMRTIRLLRATDRRVFYIDTGNLEPEAAKMYLNDAANNFKRAPAIDPLTGQEDLKYNVLGVDQDYFIAVRGDNDRTKIESLAGQTQIDIVDIEYDLNLLCAGLGIPKTYLNFTETAGEGKSLAMQDIRFARRINRIQQALLIGLNQLAVTHLIAKGLDEEVSNFTISLNNPSLQSDILRIELLTSKMTVYKDLIEPNVYGIAAMSSSRAKKEILGMTDAEILEDLNQQRLERGIGAELQKTEQIIPKSGIFNVVDTKFGDPNAQYTTNTDGSPALGVGGNNDATDTGLDIGQDTNSPSNQEDTTGLENLENK